MAPSLAEPVSSVPVPNLVAKAQYVAPQQQATHEEYQYLNLIRDILDNGEHRPDR